MNETKSLGSNLDLILKVVPIAISLGVLLLGLGLIKPSPNFDISGYATQTNSTQRIHISVTNTGWVQAGKTTFQISASEPVSLSDSICPEGTTAAASGNSTFVTTFERFSTRFGCAFDFVTSNSTSISHVTISSEGAPGWVFLPLYEKAQDVTVLNFRNYALSQGDLSLLLGLTGLMTMGILLAPSIILNVIRRPARKDIKQDEAKEQILINELDKLMRISKNLSELPNRGLVDPAPSMFSSIESEIVRTELDLQKIFAKRNLKKSHGNQGEQLYFIASKYFRACDWTENMIRRLAKDKGLSVSTSTSMAPMISAMAKSELDFTAVIEDFKIVSNFRTSLMEGSITNNISEVEHRLEMIFKQYRTIARVRYRLRGKNYMILDYNINLLYSINIRIRKVLAAQARAAQV